jgi:hypothetical protein
MPNAKEQDVSKTKFLAFTLDCGPALARNVAYLLGITDAQIKAWELALPVYRKQHHY